MNPGTTYKIRRAEIPGQQERHGGRRHAHSQRQLAEAAGSFGNRFSLYSGTVGGSGIIYASRGLTNTGGTVSPGNSIGTLSFVGSYSQGSGGKLLIEVASPASNDLLAVTGGASLSGTLETSWLGGATPAIGTVFGSVLTATAGVSGRFTSLLTNIMPRLSSNPNTVIRTGVPRRGKRDYTNQVCWVT